MTGYDDDDSVRGALSDREADALLRGPELAGFVADLQGLASAAPAPSPALAAVLANGLVPDVTAVIPVPVRRRRRMLVPVPLALLLVGGTVGAASANALPEGAQRMVSDAVSSITPIHLPRPADRPRPVPAPTTSPAVVTPPAEDPKPATLPTSRPTARPSARPTLAGDRDDDRQGQAPAPRRTTARPAGRSAPVARDDDGRDDDRSGSTGGDDHHEDGGGDHRGR